MSENGIDGYETEKNREMSNIIEREDMDELGGRRMRWFLVSIVLMGIFVERGEGQLVENFYKSTCPKLEQIVRQAVRNKFSQTIITIPATLRLFFHDCFVEVYIYI